METKRCDNLACVCDVALAETTCSDYCGSFEARDTNTIKCECGHDRCARRMDAELEGTPTVS